MAQAYAINRRRRAVHTVDTYDGARRNFRDKGVALFWMRAFTCLMGRDSAVYKRRPSSRARCSRASDRDAVTAAKRILARFAEER